MREVVADFVGDGFVEDALGAEGLEVELEGLELDAALVSRLGSGSGDVSDGDRAEVGVSGFGAEGGELFGEVLDEEGVIAGLVGRGEGFEE